MAMRVRDIAAAVGGESAPTAAEIVCTGVATDSRAVSPGDLYVAIVGDRVDGNDFACAAAEAGAAACVVSKEQVARIPCILVGDTVAALGRLAAYHRRRFSVPIVAITGSTGKTTTKDMVTSILEQELAVAKTAGNQNNEIGLPMTLLRLDALHGAAVVEFGMRGSGQIARLAAIAAPTVGVVTNVGDTHIELLGSREAIRDAKAELVEALSPGGCAVLNWDDDLVRDMGGRTPAQVCYYGTSGGAHVSAHDICDLRLGGVAFRLLADWRGRRVDLAITLPLPGLHNVANGLAACAAGIVLGMTDASLVSGMAGLVPGAMRMQVLDAPSGVTVINDTYNASPASMKAALTALRSLSCGRRAVAVLADMLELGSYGTELHQEIGRQACRVGVLLLVTVGDLAEHMARAYVDEVAGTGGSGLARPFAGKPGAIEFLRAQLRAGDVVLVKGSRGMGMEEVVGDLLRTP